MNEYMVLTDGYLSWPARREDMQACLDENSDPFDGRVCIPAELMDQIGFGIGSKKCEDLCARLLEEGAEKLSAPPARRRW
jgi:hypothetical protein